MDSYKYNNNINKDESIPGVKRRYIPLAEIRDGAAARGRVQQDSRDNQEAVDPSVAEGPHVEAD